MRDELSRKYEDDINQNQPKSHAEESFYNNKWARHASPSSFVMKLERDQNLKLAISKTVQWSAV